MQGLSLARDGTGASAIEYVLVLALVSLAAIGGFTLLGESTSAKVRCAANAISTGNGRCLPLRADHGQASRSVEALTAGDPSARDRAARGTGALAGRGTGALTARGTGALTARGGRGPGRAAPNASLGALASGRTGGAAGNGNGDAFAPSDATTSCNMLLDPFCTVERFLFGTPPNALGGDPTPPSDDDRAAHECELPDDAPLVFLYSSPGDDRDMQFLTHDCSAEVVVGEKRDRGPRGRFAEPDAHALGGRTAFVFDRNGEMIRERLARPNGLERTLREIRHLLASGYDYIAIDEITAHPDWDDDALVARRFRSLLRQLPPRKVIPYISIDLTMKEGGLRTMRERRKTLATVVNRGRAAPLEVFLHTDQVMAGQAPVAAREAARRLQVAVGDLAHEPTSRRAITVSGYATRGYVDYRYLDDRPHDMQSIARQGAAIRESHDPLLSQQRGVAYYFVGGSSLEPLPGAPYTLGRLVGRLANVGRRAAHDASH